ncbi:hypothetical protein ACIOZL_23355 [Streptomyces sp. NPDC087769]|uniref:hypothetical protein n=1 Tax=unclassified Streptomyces TaxID=2593676 RepID=UPI0037208C92
MRQNTTDGESRQGVPAVEAASSALREVEAAQGRARLQAGPLMSLIAAAAATDPEIAAQWPAGPDPRYTVQHAAAKALTSKPDACPDVHTARAADLL